jgi:type I restriction enzyme, S subunit
VSPYPAVPLSDVLQISSERVEPLSFADRSFNYVGLENIEGHTGRVTTMENTRGGEIQSTKNVFHKGQILYGKLRPYLNKVHLAKDDGICSTDIFVLTSHKKRLLASFAAYYLRSESTLEAVKNLTVGANLPRIDAKGFLSITIPVPTISEQERIVRILDDAESLRELRRNVDKMTISIEPALLQELLGTHAANPFGWAIETVGNLFCDSRNGVKCGPFGSALKKDEYSNTGVPVWGIPNVLPNQFVEEGSLFIPTAKFLELQAYAVKLGDLLISRAGTVGRICVARPRATKSIIGTNLIRLRLDQSKVLPEFVAALLTYRAGDVGELRADTSEASYSFMNTTVLPEICTQSTF